MPRLSDNARPFRRTTAPGHALQDAWAAFGSHAGAAVMSSRALIPASAAAIGRYGPGVGLPPNQRFPTENQGLLRPESEAHSGK